MSAIKVVPRTAFALEWYNEAVIGNLLVIHLKTFHGYQSHAGILMIL